MKACTAHIYLFVELMHIALMASLCTACYLSSFAPRKCHERAWPIDVSFVCLLPLKLVVVEYGVAEFQHSFPEARPGMDFGSLDFDFCSYRAYWHDAAQGFAIRCFAVLFLASDGL